MGSTNTGLNTVIVLVRVNNNAGTRLKSKPSLLVCSVFLHICGRNQFVLFLLRTDC